MAIAFNDLMPHNVQDWVNFTHRGMALIAFIWIGTFITQ